MKLGKITHEEVAHHPQRNVIIRAIQGTDRPTEADVVLLDDIKAGDFLFMCSDGVLERLNNDELSDIFKHLGGPEEIKNAIMSACSGKTRDNFSFYIGIIHVHPLAPQHYLQVVFKPAVADFTLRASNT